MELIVRAADGNDVRFECADTWVSKWVCEPILRGETYPVVGFVDDVQVVFDVGANCGAATVHLARTYPSATVHSFEPAEEPRALLRRNVAPLSGVRVHPIGLSDHDAQVALYRGTEDSITGSVHQRSVNHAEHETVELRSACAWVAEHGIERIDILKLDVEGCEVEVLESLSPMLPTVKVLYVEYDSRQARRQIDDLLRSSHELYFALVQSLDQGECVYLHRDLADHPDAKDQLKRFLRPDTPVDPTARSEHKDRQEPH